MRLVFVYGPPGVGKLTVARELAGRTGFKLLPNHLTANLASALYPHGSDEHSTTMSRWAKRFAARCSKKPG